MRSHVLLTLILR